MSTASIESQSRFFVPVFAMLSFFRLAFVQHFDSSFNTMTYFQEKLQQLLVSIARESLLVLESSDTVPLPS